LILTFRNRSLCGRLIFFLLWIERQMRNNREKYWNPFRLL